MSAALLDEITNNFKVFESQWPVDLMTAKDAISTAQSHFVTSYLRISSIQAWRTSIIQKKLDDNSAAFFFESQNDLLISHCLARCGSFRQALKSLRSAIENILFALYYKDHLVELQLWEAGHHKVGFTSLSSYFESHPLIKDLPQNLTGLPDLKSEYSTLSKAVHGSAKVFRMTENLSDIKLWDSNLPSVGKWATREKAVIGALNFLLLGIYRDELSGARHQNLRKTIGLILPKTKHAEIKSKLGVNLNFKH